MKGHIFGTNKSKTRSFELLWFKHVWRQPFEPVWPDHHRGQGVCVSVCVCVSNMPLWSWENVSLPYDALRKEQKCIVNGPKNGPLSVFQFTTNKHNQCATLFLATTCQLLTSNVGFFFPQRCRSSVTQTVRRNDSQTSRGHVSNMPACGHTHGGLAPAGAWILMTCWFRSVAPVSDA